MVRRRKRGRSPPAGDTESGMASPTHVRRPSPEYSAMPPPTYYRGRSPVANREALGSSSSASLSPSPDRRSKKHKKRHHRLRRSRSRSPFSSASDVSDANHHHKKKKRKKNKKSRKKTTRDRSPSRSGALTAAAAAAASRLGGASGGPHGIAEGEEDEPIVIFDRASRAFTAEIRSTKEAPVGGLNGSEGQALDVINYRRAFGLSCGTYTFVSEGTALPPAAAAAVSAAAAQAAAAGGPKGGLLMTSNKGGRGETEIQNDFRVNPKTHPHLYWSCWKCSALNYKTRHQCYKCNRLFQR